MSLGTQCVLDWLSAQTSLSAMATFIENLEMSRNLTAVRGKSGKRGKKHGNARKLGIIRRKLIYY